MEIFPYIIDVLFFAFALYWSAANSVRPKGEPTFGLFRYRETRHETGAAAKPPTAAQRLLQRR